MNSSLPIVLSPSTPSELLTYILSHQRYPTTIIITWPRTTFIDALVEDVKQQNAVPQEHTDDGEGEVEPKTHHLQRPTLLQIAVSRYIRLIFVPSVVHLRVLLGTFSRADSKVPAPPDYTPPEPATEAESSASGATNTARSKYPTPMLLVYGFLEIHRDGREWSAQGIGVTTAFLIEAAARNCFRAAMVEPRGSQGYEVLDEFLNEQIPILSGTPRKDDGTWGGVSGPVRRVLGRWFEFETPGER